MACTAPEFDAIRERERVRHDGNLCRVLLLRVIRVRTDLRRSIVKLELDKKTAPATQGSGHGGVVTICRRRCAGPQVPVCCGARNAVNGLARPQHAVKARALEDFVSQARRTWVIRAVVSQQAEISPHRSACAAQCCTRGVAKYDARGLHAGRSDNGRATPQSASTRPYPRPAAPVASPPLMSPSLEDSFSRRRLKSASASSSKRFVGAENDPERCAI